MVLIDVDIKWQTHEKIINIDNIKYITDNTSAGDKNLKPNLHNENIKGKDGEKDWQVDSR